MHQAFSSQARPGSEVPPRAERAMSPIPGGRVKPVLSAANILVGETKASEPRSGQGGAGFEGRANLSKSLGRREEAGDWPSARPTHCPPPTTPGQASCTGVMQQVAEWTWGTLWGQGHCSAH